MGMSYDDMPKTRTKTVQHEDGGRPRGHPESGTNGPSEGEDPERLKKYFVASGFART